MKFVMFDLGSKNFCQMFSFIGCEQGVTIVEEYDRKSLFPMFLKCHHHVHPMVEFKSYFANQGNDEDSSLNTITSEAIKNLSNIESC
jgi:hypothetical protein